MHLALALGIQLRSFTAVSHVACLVSRNSARHFSSVTALTTMMTPTEKYLFDLNGFLHIRGVLTPDEVKAANAAIDFHQDELKGRTQTELRNTQAGTPLAGDGKTPRLDLGGMLGWKAPHRDVFRKLLAHPRLVPYLRELLGEGYRMDHQPLVIASEKGAEGFSLHGGTIDASGNYTPYLAYHYSHGRMHNNLLACSVSLVDHPKGSGGFVVVRGSHKANFPTPPELANGLDDLGGCIHQPETKAGDVILFSEASVHGAAPWTMDYQRRIALYRFAPATVAYGRSYFPSWGDSVMEGLTAEQAAVLQPPYNVRLDRPLVAPADPADPAAGVTIEVKSRPAAKKEWDRKVFGTDYF